MIKQNLHIDIGDLPTHGNELINSIIQGKTTTVGNCVCGVGSITNDNHYYDTNVIMIYNLPGLTDRYGSYLFHTNLCTRIAHVLSTNILQHPIEINSCDYIINDEHQRGNIILKSGICNIQRVFFRDGLTLGVNCIYVDNECVDKTALDSFMTKLTQEQQTQAVSLMDQTFYNLAADAWEGAYELY